MSELPGAASAVVTVATNADGWFTSVSPGFLALIGQPVEALAGVNVVDLVHPLDAAGARGLIAAASVDPEATVRFFTANDRWSAMRVRTTTLPDGRVNFALSPMAEPAPAVQAIAPAADTKPAADAGPAVSPLSSSILLDADQPAASIPSAPAPSSAGLLQAGRQSRVSGFDYSDSEYGFDYSALRPSAEVADERAAVRAAATAAGATAMLEVDTGGRTVFVSGDWTELAADDHADAGSQQATTFEQLLHSVGQGEMVLGLVHQAIRPGEPGDAIVELHGHGLRHVHSEPIASPLIAGVKHALVSMAPAPAGATVSAVGDPSWTPPATPFAADVEEPSSDAPEAGQPEGDAALGDATTAVDEVEAEPKRRRAWMWVALAAVLLLALWALFGRSDDAASGMGPVDVEVGATEPVEVEPGQTWRPLGVAGLDEIHGVAAIDDGALVASLTGRIVRLDDDGLAQSMVVVGDPVSTTISDLAADSDGTSWALDAGLAQIYRVSSDGDVTILEANFDPLRNARGIGLGRDNTIWVASTASSQLVRIGRDGGVVSTLPFPGRQPSDVVELADGTLWFVDAELIELVHVSAAGETIATLPIEGFFSNESPHLAVVDDLLWVTEPNQGSVFAVDLGADEPSGDRIMLARSGGERVERPIGLSAGAGGRLWTVDSLGRAVIVLDN